MYVYIVRHAWAYDRDSQRWPDDGQRPLTPEGRDRFKKVAKALVRRGVEPARVATSPLVRCRQTADILLEYLARTTQLLELEALLEWTRQSPEADVAWVGHAPDVDELTAALIGEGSAAIHFSKGAVAALRIHRLAPGGGQLDWLVTAKMLGL
jgi:phosphohistidine phosphatase